MQAFGTSPSATSVDVLRLTSSLDNLNLSTGSGYSFWPSSLALTRSTITSDSSGTSSSLKIYNPSSSRGETSCNTFSHGSYSSHSDNNIAAPQPHHLSHTMGSTPYTRVKGLSKHRDSSRSNARSEVHTGWAYAPYSTNIYGHEASRGLRREAEKNYCNELEDGLHKLQEPNFEVDLLTKTRITVLKRRTIQVRELSALNEQLEIKVAWGDAEITRRDAEIAHLHKVIEALRGVLRGILNAPQ